MDITTKFQEVEFYGNLLKDPQKQLEAIKYFESLIEYSQIIELCLYSIINTNQDLVQFHMANILKISLPIYICQFDAEKFNSIFQSIFNLINQSGKSISCIIQLTEAFSILIKLRGCQTELNQIANIIDSLILDIQQDKQSLQLDLCLSILNEFNASTCSNINTSMDTQLSCQQWFQDRYIVPLFSKIVEILTQLHYANSHNILTQKFLLILNKIFEWRFNIDQDLVNSSNQFPTHLTQIFNTDSFYESLTKIYLEKFEDFNIRNNIEQIYKILCQLDESSFSEYSLFQLFQNQLLNFICHIFSKIPLLSYPATMVNACEISFNCIESNSLAKLANLSHILILLNQCSNCTIMCLENCDFDDNNTHFYESIKLLFQLWSNLVSKLVSFQYYSRKASNNSLEIAKSREIAEFLSEIAPSIVSEFIELMAKQSSHPDLTLFSIEYNAFDPDMFISVAGIARYNLESILPSLSISLEQSISLFFQMDLTTQVNRVESEFYDLNLNAINRKIECLILLFGYIFTDFEEGEHCKIPPSIIEYSKAQQNTQEDLCLRIPAFILEYTTQICSQAQFNLRTNESNAVDYPLWFINRWAGVYLFFNVDDYNGISQNLLSSFSSAPLGIQCQSISHTLLEIANSIFSFKEFSSNTRISYLATLTRLMNKSPFFNQVKLSNSHSELLQTLCNNLNHYSSQLQRPIIEYLLLPNTLRSTDINLFNIINTEIENQIHSLIAQSLSNPHCDYKSKAICVYLRLNGMTSSVDFDTFDSYFQNLQTKFSAHLRILVKLSTEVEVWIACFDWVIKLINILDSFGDSADYLKSLLNMIHSTLKMYLNNINKLDKSDLDEEYDIILFMQILENLIHLDNTNQNIGVIEQDSDIVPKVVLELSHEFMEHLNDSKLQSFEVQSRYTKLISTLLSSYGNHLKHISSSYVERLYLSLRYGVENFSPEYSDSVLGSIKQLIILFNNEQLVIGSAPYQLIRMILSDSFNLVINNKVNSQSLDNMVIIFTYMVLYHQEIFSNLMQNLAHNFGLATQANINEASQRLYSAVGLTNDVNQLKPVISSFIFNLKSLVFLK
ncbi:hypothetical protein CONCODRAFT_18418 [Conidiobolus coronatus NRRL 28638]|uniref:Exportin-1 C-terminal domain-containing protein n=1 Tax=Conidiobolus coronatus (strain ATCC 28846 / CBS 209.66 / NRRL 28638) TaxID=796925 RepID=A0A137P2N9_CONC2|nr:hypothetical protein CONCODRAFT_18418 [Conidiobolus coronatus NRRL 28638]|eukprot:KXN69282.1 hypothetical protein CONCODRAFT_18418 [Conidiobolus coronatus NRRL 28638]